MNRLEQLLIEKRQFEVWAQSHGGLSLERAGIGGSTRKGLFPSTYLEDETEIAWRAWANKPTAAQPVAVFDGYLDGGAAVIQWRGKGLPAGTVLYAEPRR